MKRATALEVATTHEILEDAIVCHDKQRTEFRSGYLAGQVAIRHAIVNNDGLELTWSEALDRPIDQSTTDWEDISGRHAKAARLVPRGPLDGSLAPRQLAIVMGLLAQDISTPVLCLFWEGYWSVFSAPQGRPMRPLLDFMGLQYLVTSSTASRLSFESFKSFSRGPSICLSVEEGWIVASDIDAYCSWVAADADGLAALRASHLDIADTTIP